MMFPDERSKYRQGDATHISLMMSCIYLGDITSDVWSILCSCRVVVKMFISLSSQVYSSTRTQMSPKITGVVKSSHRYNRKSQVDILNVLYIST